MPGDPPPDGRNTRLVWGARSGRIQASSIPRAPRKLARDATIQSPRPTTRPHEIAPITSRRWRPDDTDLKPVWMRKTEEGWIAPGDRPGGASACHCGTRVAARNLPPRRSDTRRTEGVGSTPRLPNSSLRLLRPRERSGDHRKTRVSFRQNRWRGRSGGTGSGSSPRTIRDGFVTRSSSACSSPSSAARRSRASRIRGRPLA